MSQVTARQAASRARPQPAEMSPAGQGIGLLPALILVLAIFTALVHLDKALTLGFPFGHPIGIQFGGGMPAGGAGAHGAAPGGMPAPGGGTGRPPAGRGPSLPLPLPVLFFLNFLGYIVLAAALYLPVPVLQRYRFITRWLLIAFAAATIWGYVAIVGEVPNALGAFDKAAEISLILFLLIEAYYLRVTGSQASDSRA